jgi:hypothetical protein
MPGKEPCFGKTLPPKFSPCCREKVAFTAEILDARATAPVESFPEGFDHVGFFFSRSMPPNGSNQQGLTRWTKTMKGNPAVPEGSLAGLV